MSNENMHKFYNKLFTVKDDHSKQDSNPLQQQILHSVNETHESQDFINKKIIDELCKLHENEAFKGSYDSEFINAIEKYLENNQLNSKDLIDLCLNNQTNSILLTILARCYRYGKWSLWNR
ncbi:hypothetical protein F8M41_017787 [Gigaspora margarita]|uniref:Uncharacterized protein n=1 Tax=Gigaspora margarita TaxID=4874 RepID=A0A8H4ELX1_GIGMA|nr:hypothetical protein F8M41_017787 [Gigaspora margarita]